MTTKAETPVTNGNAADTAALRQAAKKMAAILVQHNVTEEDVVADYRLERAAQGRAENGEVCSRLPKI